MSATFRLAFLLAFLLVAQIGEGTRAVVLSPAAQGVVIGASLYCLLVLICYARWGDRPQMRPMTMFIDLVLVTAFIGAVPGLGPNFFPVYFLLVVMAGVWMGLGAAISVAVLCCISYTVATFIATPAEWIPPPMPLPQYDSPRILRALRVVAPAVPWILLVAIAAGMMAKAQERALQAQEEIKAARRLQEMLFAKRLPPTPGYDLGTAFHPARDVGGDYFDVLAMSDDRVGVCIADVSGRGVVAALHLSLLKYAVHAAAQVHAQPGEIAAQANRILYPHFATLEFELFVGMFFAVLDLRTGQLTYVNAGHVPPFILRGSGEVRELRTGGLVLGVDTLAPYREQAARLEPGDALIVCTDGINGAVNPAGEELTAEDLAREVADMREASAEEIAERLVQRGRAFAGGVVEDDATALVMKRRPVDALEEPGTGPMEPRTDSTGPVHGDGEAR